MIRRCTWAALLVVPVLPVLLGAEPLSSIPNPRVRDGTWISDTPGALRADTVARLNETIGTFERTTGIEMAVVVMRSLDGVSIEEAAASLFAMWGIGKKDRDNGLLLLWSLGERKVRVEVGYGLEDVLPDGRAGAILDAYVIPHFRAGDFDAGILAGVDALMAAARDEDVELPLAATESYEDDSTARPSCCRWWVPSRLASDRSSDSASGGAIAVAIVRSVRPACCGCPRPMMTRCCRKDSWRRSASAVWTTTCGSARRAHTISHCATRNG
jgi:uncharacterized membrane protein YgcG